MRIHTEKRKGCDQMPRGFASQPSIVYVRVYIERLVVVAVYSITIPT